jgi:hypothetical protein
MTHKSPVGAVVIGAAILCLSPLAHAEDKWWRATAAADLNLPGAIEACAKLVDETKGFDRIGCAITAILAGRTALARDQFLLVTEADARNCIQETSSSATDAPPVLVLVIAYCKTKLGSFPDSRRLLESLTAPAGNSDATDTSMWFEAFRTVILLVLVQLKEQAKWAMYET